MGGSVPTHFFLITSKGTHSPILPVWQWSAYSEGHRRNSLCSNPSVLRERALFAAFHRNTAVLRARWPARAKNERVLSVCFPQRIPEKQQSVFPGFDAGDAWGTEAPGSQLQAALCICFSSVRCKPGKESRKTAGFGKGNFHLPLRTQKCKLGSVHSIPWLQNLYFPKRYHGLPG